MDIGNIELPRGLSIRDGRLPGMTAEDFCKISGRAVTGFDSNGGDAHIRLRQQKFGMFQTNSDNFFLWRSMQSLIKSPTESTVGNTDMVSNIGNSDSL